MIHTLKTLPAYFAATTSGEKTFEIRDNKDRGFQKGDTVVLREYDPSVLLGGFTGNEIEVKITYVTNFEQKEGYVVFGVESK